MASTTLDLPDPFGPTTTVTPGSNWSVVGSANDLKPLRVSDFKNTAGPTLVASTPPPRDPPLIPSGPTAPARLQTIWAPLVDKDRSQCPGLAPRSPKRAVVESRFRTSGDHSAIVAAIRLATARGVATI